MNALWEGMFREFVPDEAKFKRDFEPLLALLVATNVPLTKVSKKEKSPAVLYFSFFPSFPFHFP